MRRRDNIREQALTVLLALFNTVQQHCVFFGLRHSLLRIAGIRVGPGAVVHRRVCFTSNGKCVIGGGTVINHDVYLDNRKGIEIGQNVMIGQGTRIFTLGHDVHAADFRAVGGAVKIGDYAVLFADAKVMPGVSIGAAAVIFPGAVVTKDVPPGALMGGVPARCVGQREKNQSYRLDYPIWFGR